ncbi:hypothetical protein [Dictyobacter kobayashii]|uniref:hypothetical protein n=1 Tax=Dictyobacter kobayashii TaxID=2014872 RepID=UPI000F81AB11|nr:hypothetical protein [Dictyobacter kobayashii]
MVTSTPYHPHQSAFVNHLHSIWKRCLDTASCATTGSSGSMDQFPGTIMAFQVATPIQMDGIIQIKGHSKERAYRFSPTLEAQ